MIPADDEFNEWNQRPLLEGLNSSTEFTDSELLEGIGRNEESAFEILYERYAPTLYAICLRILKHEFEAREVLSEIFLEVWAKSDRYDAQRGPLRAYLSTLARCRSIDRLRSNTSKNCSQARLGELWYWTDRRKDSFAPHEQLEQVEEIASLRDAMRNLNDLQRKALSLAYFDGQTHLEVAQSLKIPLGTAKTAIRRGIAILRECILGLSSQKQEVDP
jgi:RNA polymerase sigma-70 factor, ECF subfamily